MDSMLQALLSWQFLLFCLAIAAITFVVRKIAEYVLDNPSVPASKESKFWNKLMLPILPVFLGTVGALIAKQYPYPDGLTTTSGRVAFGLVAGLLSTLVYRVVNSFLTSKLSAIVGSGSSANTNSVPVSDPETTPVAVIATPAVEANVSALADKVRQSINQ